MVTALPRVWIDGKEYFRDDRLEEFRAVDNPHDRITFEQIRQAYLHVVSVMNYLFSKPKVTVEKVSGSQS